MLEPHYLKTWWLHAFTCNMTYSTGQKRNYHSSTSVMVKHHIDFMQIILETGVCKKCVKCHLLQISILYYLKYRSHIRLYLWKLMLLKVVMSTICRLVSLVSKSLLSFTACSIWSWLVVSGKDCSGEKQLHTYNISIIKYWPPLFSSFTSFTCACSHWGL